MRYLINRWGNNTTAEVTCMFSTDNLEAWLKAIAEIKKKYRYRYPNINDSLVRITSPVEEDSSCDETFSSLTPKELEKRRKKKFK